MSLSVPRAILSPRHPAPQTNMNDQTKQALRYNEWANRAFARLLEDLPSELLDREVVSSFPSLRKTVEHVFDAETLWLMRLRGERTDGWPGSVVKDSSSIGFFLERSRELREHGLGLTHEASEEPIRYLDTEGGAHANTAIEMIQHCVNHSSFHRGQLVTMLRQLGVTQIPQTDLIHYLRVREPSR